MRGRLFCLLGVLFPFTLSAQPIWITGFVGEDRKPFVGAEVELHPAVVEAVEGTGIPVPLKSTRTGKDGSFELPAPGIGAYRVVVRAKDRLAMEHLVVPLIEDAFLLPVEMRGSASPIQELESEDRSRRMRTWYPAEARPGMSGTSRPQPVEAPAAPERPKAVTGRVTDALTRKPIAGALVWSGLPPERPPVRTGADGKFRLPVPPGGTPWIGVAAPGYQLPDRQPARTGTVAVALQPAATVRGQVVDSSGAPVAGAVLHIQPGPSRVRSLSSLAFMPIFRTRSDGSFLFADLVPGGTYKLFAKHPGHGLTEVQVRTPPAGGKPALPERIVLGSGITATGRVVDEAGDPVEGAEVTMIGAESPVYGDVFQDASKTSGVFSIPHLMPGPFSLTVRRAGFAALWRDGVQVPEGEARFDVGELVLKAGAAIEGRVTDERGRPVEGAEILLSSEMESLNSLSMFRGEEAASDIRTGPEGRFRIDGLEPGRSYDVFARHSDHPPATVRGIKAPTADPVHVEFEVSRNLSLRVVGPEGEPVPDAEVQTLEEGLATASAGSLGRTNSRGELRKGGLKPGALDLEVTARGYRDTRWRGVQIPRERDPDPVTVALERAPVLEGRALDEEGNPVPDAEINIRPKVLDGDIMLRLMLKRPSTDSEGRFRIDGLAPGEYTVSAQIPGTSRRTQSEVRLGSEAVRVDLVFERGAEVSGRVLDEAGDPIPSAYVRVDSPEGGTEAGGYCEADGSFRLQAVEEGDLSLVASAKGYAESAPQLLRVTGSGVDGIEVRLSREAAGTITGRVLGLSAEALSRARIMAEKDVGWDSADSVVDEQGRYRLPGLRAGTWKVRAWQPNGIGVDGEVRLEPGSEAVLDLQFPEGLTFSGRVSLGERPLAGAEIIVASEESQSQTRSDSEGRFSIGPMKEGSHSVLILAGSLAVHRAVVLQEGRELLLEIETGGLQGRILAAGGEPVPDAAIQVRSTDPGSGSMLPMGPSARSDGQGSFEMLSIPAGAYTVIVQKPGFEEAQVRVEVQPGPATVRDVVLKERE